VIVVDYLFELKEQMSVSSTTDQPQQWLVSLNNKTHVLSLLEGQPDHGSADEDDTTTNDNHPQFQRQILEALSFRTGWPISSLLFPSKFYRPFIHVRIQSSLRGGKGGFGTLLRSSARQSGARLTTDFGACRDLQGRRLRHVNDEIKLRKWREAQAKAKETGDKTGAGITDAMFDTPSGLYNWHLMVRRTLCSFLVCDSSLLLHF